MLNKMLTNPIYALILATSRHLVQDKIMTTRTASTLRPLLWTALLFSAGWVAMWHGTANADSCPSTHVVHDKAVNPAGRAADAGMTGLLLAHWAATGAPAHRLPASADGIRESRP
jgi:hypothetical protein